jgi:hypothetical protein
VQLAQTLGCNKNPDSASHTRNISSVLGWTLCLSDNFSAEVNVVIEESFQRASRAGCLPPPWQEIAIFVFSIDQGPALIGRLMPG